MTEVPYGYSALHNAVITRDVKAVRTLTATTGRCDLESRDSMGFTPLHLATLQGKQDVVQMLVLAGCDINSRTKEGMTSLHISSEHTGAEGILCVLASASCDVNARNKLGRTALHLAAKQGNLQNLRTLLDAGCDRNIKDKLGFTAVGLAFKFNQKGSADVLLHYKPRRNQTFCKETVPDETLSKEAAGATENVRVHSECSEVKLSDKTTSMKSHERCDKTLLKLMNSVANRKALSLKIYHLIVAILTQKRNVLDGLASSNSRKKLESVETVFERKILNLILTSTSFIQYPFVSCTITTLKVRKQCLCDLKPRAFERNNPLSCNLESSVLAKLLQDLSASLFCRNQSKSIAKCDRSLPPPLNWKPQEKESTLEDFKAFAQMLVKVCNGGGIDKSTTPCDNSTLQSPCDNSTLHDRCEQKLTDINTDAYVGGLEKLKKLLALEDSGKHKDDLYEFERAFVDDNIEEYLSCLDDLISMESSPASFVEDVLEVFFQNSNIFISCLKQRGSLFSTLFSKVLSVDGPWMADKIAKIFLQVCVALETDQRLLISCAGVVMRRGLSHKHCNAVALGTCILVRMGLLKQEDEVDIVKDLKGPLLALEHLCTEVYFPRDLAAIFASFLGKSSPKLFGLDQLRLRALASAVTKEVLPTSAQDAAGCDTGKGFKRICNIAAVEEDWELLLKCVDALFSRVFVTLRCDAWPIGESILIYLGLLKSEFHIETVRNLNCALKLLHHTVMQSYFPPHLKPLLVCFLQKPNPALTPYSREVDEILSTLITGS